MLALRETRELCMMENTSVTHGSSMACVWKLSVCVLKWSQVVFRSPLLLLTLECHLSIIQMTGALQSVGYHPEPFSSPAQTNKFVCVENEMFILLSCSVDFTHTVTQTHTLRGMERLHLSFMKFVSLSFSRQILSIVSVFALNERTARVERRARMKMSVIHLNSLPSFSCHFCQPNTSSSTKIRPFQLLLFSIY